MIEIKKIEDASQKDISYLQEDLIKYFNEFYDGIKFAQKNAKDNKETAEKAINLDYDTLEGVESKKITKKPLIAGLIGTGVSIAGILGLASASILTKNPTFFSVGNVATLGIAGIMTTGFANYFQIFKNKKLEKIKKDRQMHLDSIPFSNQSVHDKREIEVNEAYFEAIGNKLGLDDISTEALRLFADMLEKKQNKGVEI